MMKRIFISIAITISLFACTTNKKGKADRFKYGEFKVLGNANLSDIIIKRFDSIQIEEYTEKVSISNGTNNEEKLIKHVDTFYITWKNSFNYYCKMKNPKTDLDKETQFFQITKVEENSYEYVSRIGYTKYKSTGTVFKIK